MIRILRPLVVALSLAACAATSAGGTGGEPSGPRERWARQGMDDYRFVFSRECFCLGRGPVQVVVRDGRVAEVRNPQTGAPAGENEIIDVMTVDELFDRIEQARARGEHTDVEYHPTLGYPTTAEIGTLANDAGTRYHVADLRPLD